MLLRIAVFGMIALGLGGFGTVAWLALRPPEPPATVAPASESAAPPPPPVRHIVLAAALSLRAGTLLKPEDVAPREVGDVPAGAQDDSAAMRAGLVGAMLRRSLLPGETLLASDVMRPGDHGFLAAVLAPGKRAASVAVDAVSGSAGLIWPGDHVDLILTLSLDDPATPPGRRYAAETMLSDARVIAIDQLLAHGVAPSSEGGARTVTLEVSEADAQRIAVATRMGRLSLAVRAAEATAPAPPNPPDAALAARVLTTWGGDVSPALSGPAPSKTTGSTLQLYQGNADGKEFRF